MIFSQYTAMLELIKNYLRGLGIGSAGLRGGMSLPRRKQEIDKLISRRRVLADKLVQADDGKLVKRLGRQDLLDLLSF